MSFQANFFATFDLPRYPLGKSGYPMKAPCVDFQQYFGIVYVYVCVPCFAHSSMHPHFSLRRPSVPKASVHVKPKEENAKANAAEPKYLISTSNQKNIGVSNSLVFIFYDQDHLRQEGLDKGPWPKNRPKPKPAPKSLSGSHLGVLCGSGSLCM